MPPSFCHANALCTFACSAVCIPVRVVAEETGRGLPGLVNLIGIDSPGLTSSLALAEEVDRLLPG